MSDMIITKETEEKRLRDFQKIAENWDTIPEYAKGKLDGTISTIAAIFGSGTAQKNDRKNQPGAGSPHSGHNSK